ncbi:hypothetical protein BJ138DRAFT_974970, partial [Hygrophoropsis aurantiaca]
IEVIKFAWDFEAQGSGEGGKRWKQDFNVQTFQLCSPVAKEFIGLSSDEKKAKMGELVHDFSAWKRKSEESVTNRNQLLKLYRTV